MTGRNNRVVNPNGQPLKGYWIVVHDSGQTNLFWRKVNWTDNLLTQTNCAVEVRVRASNERLELGSEPFRAVTNNVPFTGINGRYLEVRVALKRDAATSHPVLYDLTLHSATTTFEDWFLDDEVEFETGDATFVPLVSGAGPFTYQWQALYPWKHEWEALPDQTNATLTVTNLDSWDHENWFGVEVTSPTGESLFVGPALLSVVPLPITIPSSGPASRYPATIEVFGQPTNFTRVEVALTNLSHFHPDDLDILLVSPSGAKIMLMSDAGGSNAVSEATLIFHPASQGWGPPPYQAAIPSNWTSDYKAGNYEGGPDPLPPPAPPGPYPVPDLDVLSGSDPNGVWRLYIYDDRQGQTGALHGAWTLKFYYQ
ncbi:MAG TPA: hypothetical protein VI136_13605 [Verrucomicrobiae bacterium]